MEEGKDENSKSKKLTYEEYMAKYRKRKYRRRRRRGGILCCFYLAVDKLVNILQSSPEEYNGIKTVLGFPMGIMIGFALYKAVLEPLSLPKDLRELVGGVLGLALASGYAMSVQVRCISWLLIPTFFGKKGRSFVGAYAIMFLISGPVHNIILNGREVVRSLVCATELAANHTAAKRELKSKPFSDGMKEFQKEGAHLKTITKKIGIAYQPIKEELKGKEDDEEEDEMADRMRKVDKYSRGRRGNRMKKIDSKNDESNAQDRSEKAEKNYRKKLEMRCEDVWNKAVINCRKKFKSLEKKCLSMIPIIGYILCLPLKLTFFCELVRVIPGAVGMECESVDVMEPGFGDTYIAAEDTMDNMDNNFEVNLQYKLVRTPEDVDYTMAEEMRKGTAHEFEKKQVWVEFLMTLLQRVLAFTFVLVLISAYKYNKKYLTDFQFDNIYISKYFRHVDARRHYQKKRTLLPLKKFESDNMIYPNTMKLMKAEKKKLSKGTFMIVMRGLVTAMIVMSAKLLYDVMDIIEKNSHVTYRQQGVHHIDIKVEGTGFMSDIIRLFLLGFNQEHSIDQVSTNFACLPHPLPLHSMDIFKIYAVYMLVWILMFFESYGLRMRRIICSFFYRKKEKARILYIYNEMLKKRKGYLMHLRKKVRKQARKSQLSRDSSFLMGIRRSFPRLAFLVKCFKASKANCLICEDLETDKFIVCPTPSCNFSYCPECWIDCKKNCYACVVRSTDYSDSDTSGDGSTDDDDV
ncbi:E3 ubiquitin-protein ligase DCST1-like [Ostrea edulis]|uniref:E3 ubiquitin-protein ligase DCST1-like n=1 Tax=Ostrea edulis TaxID=37623 RepID=UPI0024AFD27A|nr:E3 ubiquitin-protein ligase DCST1-like [Ostrea edulis]